MAKNRSDQCQEEVFINEEVYQMQGAQICHPLSFISNIFTVILYINDANGGGISKDDRMGRIKWPKKECKAPYHNA